MNNIIYAPSLLVVSKTALTYIQKGLEVLLAEVIKTHPEWEKLRDCPDFPYCKEYLELVADGTGPSKNKGVIIGSG